MSSEGKRHGEHVQDTTKSKDQNARKQRLDEAITEANKCLVRNDHAEAGRILSRTVIPTFRELEYTQPLSTYHSELHHDDLPWDWRDLHRFLDDPGQYIAAAEAEPGKRDSISGLTVGQSTRSTEIIQHAVESVESAITHIGITQREMKNRVDAVGFSGKIGEQLQTYEMDIGDPVRVVTTQTGALKSLYVGGTGQGKSTALETEAYDFYCRNFREGERDCKVLDLAGFRDGENWFVDIPQHQDPLTKIREEQFLPGDFTEDDDLPQPKIDIRAPLTPDLPAQDLPFDTEAGEFVVKPFVVPASSLPQTLMVSFVSERLSEGQEETIRSAYEAVDREQDDWSLRDLAEEIRGKQELSEKDRATAVNVIKSLQELGFIRTAAHDRCLDWRDIFTDIEHYTVFTQAFCRNDVARYTTFAYLYDAIKRHREKMHDIPQLALLIRELWKVAPHNRRQSAYPTVAALQESISTMLFETMRENRHSGIHVLADTQQPSDLHKAVREMFNRYVVFTTNYDTVKDIFSWVAAGKTQAFWNTLSPKAGEAGIVGQVEPAIDNRDIEFVSPVRFAPPPHHHRISPGDDVGSSADLNGWTARCKYIEREELRRPADVDGVNWNAATPSQLQIDAAQAPDPDNPDPERSPVRAFVNECIVGGDIGDYAIKRDVYDAYNEFRIKHGLDRVDWNRSTKSKFGRAFNDAFEHFYEEAAKQKENTTREGESAWLSVQLTQEGHTLVDNARTEVESAATPIRGE